MSSSAGRTALTVILLTVLCYFLFLFGDSRVSLTDPDDVFYAETAKEMLTQGSIMTPILFGQPQFEKPPLYYWLVMLSFDQFGVNSWSARFMSGLFGLLGVLGVYFFLRRRVKDETAILGAVVLATAIWWIGLSRVVLTDMVFSTLIMLSLFAFYEWFSSRGRRWLIFFGTLTALGTMTKGPMGLALPLAVILCYLSILRDWRTLRQFIFNSWWLLFLVITVPWYAYAAMKYGNAFWGEFFVHDHWDRLIRAEHQQFDKWYFYPGAIIVFFLPWTAFLPFVPRPTRDKSSLPLFLLVWFVVIGIIIDIPHSKLATYISPVYPALALLVAVGLESATQARWKRILSAGLLVAAAGALFAAVVIGPRHLPALTDSIHITFGLLAVSVLIAAAFVLADRVSRAAVVAAGGVAIFVVLSAILTFPKLEDGLTQGRLGEIVSRVGYGEKPILCSKLFARGALYYSGNSVVVMADNPNPYWSKHPVTILSTNEQVTGFVEGRDSLICVFSPRELRRFSEMTAGTGHLDTLQKAMDRTVLLFVRDRKTGLPDSSGVVTPDRP